MADWMVWRDRNWPCYQSGVKQHFDCRLLLQSILYVRVAVKFHEILQYPVCHFPVCQIPCHIFQLLIFQSCKFHTGNSSVIFQSCIFHLCDFVRQILVLQFPVLQIQPSLTDVKPYVSATVLNYYYYCTAKLFDISDCAPYCKTCKIHGPGKCDICEDGYGFNEDHTCERQYRCFLLIVIVFHH